MYVDLLEKALTYFNAQFPERLLTARREFFELTGEVFEDDLFYEERVNNYLEWFLFARPFEGAPSAFAYFADHVAAECDEAARATLDALRLPLHGLFEVLKIAPKKNTVILRSVFDKKAKYAVIERRNPVGLSKGDIIETRLVLKGDHCHFLSAFVVHPARVGKFIRKRVKAMQKDDGEKEAFIVLLQRLWMQCRRYKHVNPIRIYSEENVSHFHVR